MVLPNLKSFARPVSKLTVTYDAVPLACTSFGRLTL